MKKKLSVLICAVTMTSMLTSCALIPDFLKNGDDNEPEETVTTEETEEAEVEEEESGVDFSFSDGPGFSSGFGKKDEEGADLSDSDKKPEVIIMKKYYWETSEDNYYNKLLSGHVQIPILTEESAKYYPELAKRLESDAQKELEYYDVMVEDSRKEARDFYQEVGAPEDYSYGYILERDVLVKRADDRILSMYLSDTQYFGGVHGTSGKVSLNYDSQTGERLELWQVLTNRDGFNDLVKAELRKKYVEDTFFDLDENLSHYTTEDVTEEQDFSGDDFLLSYTWSLTTEGLEVCFAPYEIAPYASGELSVVFGYNDYPEIFDDRFYPDNKPKGYIEYFDRYTGSFDVDGDGETDFIGIDNVYDDNDYEYPTGLSLYINDKTVEMPEEYEPEFADDTKGYFVHTADGRNLIYLIALTYSDYIDLYAFDVTDGDIRYVGSQCTPSFYMDYDEETDCNIEFLLYDPDNMHFAERFDYICTFNAFKTYHVGSDGMPETDDDVYTIYRAGGWEPVTAIKSFDAECIDDADNPEPITIGKGETFEFFATDGETYVDARLSDGTKVRLYIDGRGNDIKVNGQYAEDLFKELMYSG